MRYSSRLKFDVTEDSVILKLYYGDVINTAVKMTCNDAIILGHRMIKNTVVMEDAISRASSIKGKYVRTSLRMSYDTKKKAIFAECFDNKGEVPMNYRINISKSDYESTMSNLIHSIITKNKTFCNKLYLIYNSKPFPNEDVMSMIITGKATIIFAKCFSDVLGKVNSKKSCKINCIGLRNELIDKLYKIA